MSNVYVSLDDNGTITGIIHSDRSEPDSYNIVSDRTITNFHNVVDPIGKVFDRATNTIKIDLVAELSIEKEKANIQIDDAAEAARQRHLTTTATQQLIYDLKLTEAEAYISASYPKSTTAYPLLTAQAKILGTTVKAQADTIVKTKNLWFSLAGLIEGTRLKGKSDVSTGTTYAEVTTLKEAAISALSKL